VEKGVMTKPRFFAISFTALAAIAGCQGRSLTAPSMAPAVQGPAAQATVNGEISIRSISRETGATLRLHDCSTVSDRKFCTDDLRVAVDVAVDREVSRPQLRVTFMDGLQRCAFSIAEDTAFVPQTRAVLDVVAIEYPQYSDEPGKPGDLGCPEPPTTTNVVRVEVLSRDAAYPGQSLLTKTFPYNYTFVLE
jgi:hypothetical protein